MLSRTLTLDTQKDPLGEVSGSDHRNEHISSENVHLATVGRAVARAKAAQVFEVGVTPLRWITPNEVMTESEGRKRMSMGVGDTRQRGHQVRGPSPGSLMEPRIA